MFVLIERKTGRIVERHDRDYNYFLENEWGGLFPFMKDGCLRFSYGQILGCHQYDYYWRECKE